MKPMKKASKGDMPMPKKAMPMPMTKKSKPCPGGKP